MDRNASMVSEDGLKSANPRRGREGFEPTGDSHGRSNVSFGGASYGDARPKTQREQLQRDTDDLIEETEQLLAGFETSAAVRPSPSYLQYSTPAAQATVRLDQSVRSEETGPPRPPANSPPPAYIPSLRPRKQPPTYEGKTSWEIFKTQFDIVSELNKWNYADKGAYLAVSLAGDAMSVLGSLPKAGRCDYVMLCEALALRYGEENQIVVATIQFRRRKREQGESLPKYAGEVERLFRLAYPRANFELQQQMTTDQFIEGLNDSELRVQVKLRRPATLKDALIMAMEVEAVYWAERGSPNLPNRNSAPLTGNVTPGPQHPAQTNTARVSPGSDVTQCSPQKDAILGRANCPVLSDSAFIKAMDSENRQFYPTSQTTWAHSSQEIPRQPFGGENSLGRQNMTPTQYNTAQIPQMNNPAQYGSHPGDGFSTMVRAVGEVLATRSRGGSRTRPPLVCWVCGSTEHLARNCEKRRGPRPQYREERARQNQGE